jgi:uncharacterized protein
MENMVNEEIIAIKDKLLVSVKPKKIYLFGSYARNTFTEESDYDFYLVVPDDAGDKIELSQNAYKALRGIRKRPVDIVVGYESSFAIRKEEETLEKSVLSEGVLLYDESENS